jgi:pimeloyl-ACP methyl ester carboxylesterase
MHVHDQAIAYLDEGIGSPVVLAHCSSASHKEWSSLVALLRQHHRILAPDLIGYGKSARWPEGKPLDFEADVRVIVSLAHLADAPIHLAGHSYGAAIALEAARLLGRQVRSLTLIEPVSFHLLRGSGREAEWRQVEAVAWRISQAVARGQMEEAAGVYMGFWWGRLRWWLMPRKAKQTIIASIGKVSDEFDMLERASSRTDGYRLISAPVRLIIGAKTKAPARAVIEVLSSALPKSHVKTIKGAGHMSPFTHSKQVNRLIIEHIEACDVG